uniref:Ovule protein n=1 Tax=Haemonchus placei TaxID=6290 RepID=A0A0N4VXK6_HAEPC
LLKDFVRACSVTSSFVMVAVVAVVVSPVFDCRMITFASTNFLFPSRQ